MEQQRGCGWRKVGGLYLAGAGIGVACKILPYNLHVCPTCGNGVKFSRGFSWIDSSYFAHALVECSANDCKAKEIGCPFITAIREKVKLGLMWIGEKFYTPESFIAESNVMGISKRISAIPKGFEVGKTWVLLAHKKAGRAKCTVCDGPGYECNVCHGKWEYEVPAVFYAFRPQRIEKILTEDMATKEEFDSLAKRGITPVIVEDIPRHKGSAHDKSAPEQLAMEEV